MVAHGLPRRFLRLLRAASLLVAVRRTGGGAKGIEGGRLAGRASPCPATRGVRGRRLQATCSTSVSIFSVTWPQLTGCFEPGEGSINDKPYYVSEGQDLVISSHVTEDNEAVWQVYDVSNFTVGVDGLPEWAPGAVHCQAEDAAEDVTTVEADWLCSEEVEGEFSADSAGDFLPGVACGCVDCRADSVSVASADFPILEGCYSTMPGTSSGQPWWLKVEGEGDFAGVFINPDSGDLDQWYVKGLSTIAFNTSTSQYSFKWEALGGCTTTTDFAGDDVTAADSWECDSDGDGIRSASEVGDFSGVSQGCTCSQGEESSTTTPAPAATPAPTSEALAPTTPSPVASNATGGTGLEEDTGGSGGGGIEVFAIAGLCVGALGICILLASIKCIYDRRARARKEERDRQLESRRGGSAWGMGGGGPGTGPGPGTAPGPGTSPGPRTGAELKQESLCDFDRGVQSGIQAFQAALASASAHSSQAHSSNSSAAAAVTDPNHYSRDDPLPPVRNSTGSADRQRRRDPAGGGGGPYTHHRRSVSDDPAHYAPAPGPGPGGPGGRYYHRDHRAYNYKRHSGSPGSPVRDASRPASGGQPTGDPRARHAAPSHTIHGSPTPRIPASGGQPTSDARARHAAPSHTVHGAPAPQPRPASTGGQPTSDPRARDAARARSSTVHGATRPASGGQRQSQAGGPGGGPGGPGGGQKALLRRPPSYDEALGGRAAAAGSLWKTPGRGAQAEEEEVGVPGKGQGRLHRFTPAQRPRRSESM